MYYIYLLQSDVDRNFYIGFTTRVVQDRVVEHQNGFVDSTKNRRPMKLVYYEAFADQSMARKRELDLKQFGSAYQGLIKRLGLK